MRYKKYEKFEEGIPDRFSWDLVKTNPSFKYNFISEFMEYVTHNAKPFSGQRWICVNGCFGDNLPYVIENRNGQVTRFIDPVFYVKGAEFDFCFSRFLTCGQFDSITIRSTDSDTVFIAAAVYAELEGREGADIPSEVFWIRTRAETLDLNVLFRGLFQKTVTGDGLTFREFLYALAFLHVNLTFFKGF